MRNSRKIQAIVTAIVEKMNILRRRRRWSTLRQFSFDKRIASTMLSCVNWRHESH